MCHSGPPSRWRGPNPALQMCLQTTSLQRGQERRGCECLQDGGGRWCGGSGVRTWTAGVAKGKALTQTAWASGKCLEQLQQKRQIFFLSGRPPPSQWCTLDVNITLGVAETVVPHPSVECIAQGGEESSVRAPGTRHLSSQPCWSGTATGFERHGCLPETDSSSFP